MSFPPKKAHSSQQLRDFLLELIRTSPLASKLPTERELASRFQLCRSTVNRVMVKLEEEGFVQRRVGSGTFIIPQGSCIRSSGAATGQATILLAYPDFFSYQIWRQMHELELAAHRAGAAVNTIKIMPGSSIDSLLKLVEKQPVAAGCVFLLPYGPTADELSRFSTIGVPVVLLGEVLGREQLTMPNLYEVRENFYQSGFLLANHLLEAGHRRIGVVLCEPESPNSDREFFGGIYYAASRFGLKRADLVVAAEAATESWSSGTASGYINTRELLRQHPEVTAILFETVIGAIGGRRALGEAGLRCPMDLSLVAAGEHFDFADYADPPLTTTSPAYEKLADTCISLLLNPAARTTKRFIIDEELCSRGSVFPLR